MYYMNWAIEAFMRQDEIVIFGNRLPAQEVAVCIQGEPYHRKIAAFMVSSVRKEEEAILGIPVIDVQEGERRYRDAAVVAAVMEKNLEEILEILRVHHFSNIIPMTFESDVWCEVRGNYFIRLWKRQGRRFLILEEELRRMQQVSAEGSSGTEHRGEGKAAGKGEAADKGKAEESKGPAVVKLYTVKSHMDKEPAVHREMPRWEIPIQAGADRTELLLADLRDNTGINISNKNSCYCELTVLYWLWKNRSPSAYVGICHYRRHFGIREKEWMRLAGSDIDMVLTIPIFNVPDVKGVYAHDHISGDWDMMTEAVHSLYPEYDQDVRTVGNGQYYYGYNMLIARDAVFESYCEWLFPILESCEKMGGTKIEPYQNRYIGFLAERLLTIYAVHNEGHMKIVHARKEFWP